MENKIIIASVEIKPGMILYLDHKDIKSTNFWIVFPTEKGLGIVDYNKPCNWALLKDVKSKVSAIRDIATGLFLNSGKLLWEDCIEITMEQIAEKFKVNVNQIKIKK